MPRLICTCALPWPYQGLWPNDRRDRRGISGRRADYRSDCEMMARGDRVPEVASRRLLLELTYRPPSPRSRPDLDNAFAATKSGLDGLARALGVDDRVFDAFTVRRGDPAPGGRVDVTIYDTEGDAR